MKVLVLNCGSSSIKYQLIDMANNTDVLAKGLVERIGLDMGEFTHRAKDKDKHVVQTPIPNHTKGIDLVLNALLDKELGVISDIKEISACGHRVAHGGEVFKKSALITEECKQAIKNLCELAPLHNPANLEGILAMEKLVPGMKQVAVFDTSFHQSMPPEAYLYGIPYEYYEKNRIRRYGFHGTSHKFVAPKAAKMIGKDWNDLKIISCHLGNGASIAAIKNGKSVDTSMGFTPVEGLLMGTRCGDLDLGVLLYIAEKEGLDYQGMNNLINKKSGLQGVSGISADMRDLEAEHAKGNKRATYALDLFCYRVKKYIGAYAAAMGGLDLVLFTGGIGENGTMQREMICENLEFFGIEFDKEVNAKNRGKDAVISKPNSKVAVLSVTTDEELVIATDTFNIVK